MIIYNMTGGQVRNDLGGAGYFRASRKSGNMIYKHKGIDLTLPQGPGQNAWSPITGKICRPVRVYLDTAEYTGFVIENADIRLKILYCNMISISGGFFRQGQHIGNVQDISKRYSKCIPHLHIEVIWINPLILM